MPPRPPDWFFAASAAAGVVLTPILAPAALGIIGFSAAGPVAGTLAAAIHSSIGNVAAGSAFAVAQSIGMGGAIPAGVYAISGAVTTAAAWTASRFCGEFGETHIVLASFDFFLGDEPDPALIRKQLNFGSDKEKLDAMEWLIALMSKGRDVPEYLAQVVKNVTSQIFEIRKLVYIYLLRYAEREPEISLHFIKTFQKDLNDSDPFIQVMALRVLCGISDPALIHEQLDSGSDKEKLDAMEWLIFMSKGCDVSEYFTQVIKNVTSQIFEIRKLVYMYLLRYAEQEPELSLRFINTFQHDLNDSDPLIQAMALRVLRGISRRRGGYEEGESEDGYSSDESSLEGSA
ncbi:adaptin N terminal region-domain-containing protein [Armillaria luteobubalina]|uniref:Adaptin N terminal region-domain-containing protein n=1 Tax=Armillaria luteobubalina TaxID=153913 RepID=A0AA39Q335_9AGAR|nr:adaptin N terminal region-domain-containing protein [Armillaria luteobubalina]